MTTCIMIAGKLFPYGDFFKWLCYGNGSCSHPDSSIIGVSLALSLCLDWPNFLFYRWKAPWMWSVICWTSRVFIYTREWHLLALPILW